MKTPLQRRDYQKYCKYHSNHGHNIEECMTLHFEIKKFIKNKRHDIARGMIKEGESFRIMTLKVTRC